MIGRRLGGRFTLRERIGRGSSGQVWAADDALTGARAVVKLLGLDADPERLRREVAALAALRIPGVAGLLDRGDAEDGPWIAMPFAPGRAFPGRDVPVPATELAPVATSLLEVVAAIHDAGLLHRDLKPANVLVDGHRVTVVDFGLSRGDLVGSTMTMTGEFVGTPRYASPEQVRGDPIDGRSDLYAVGCLLFEAITGRPPHPETTLSALLHARVTVAAPRVRTLAPDAPAPLATLVDRLLAIDPEDRPSAEEALRVLSGSSHTRPLPRLGPDRAPAIAHRLAAGETVRLVVPPGHGRRRLVREVERALTTLGVRHERVRPGIAPFESAPFPVGGGSVDEEIATLRERLGGVAWIAEDARVDPWTRRALDGACALRIGAEGERIEPLTVEDLEALFHGPRLCLHLPEDGAAELHARTGGVPAAVAEEVAAWVRWGLATWDGDKLRIRREAIGALKEGIWLPAGAVEAGKLPEHQEEVLAWLVLARRLSSAATLATAMGLPRARVEATMVELEDRGLLRRASDGRLLATVSSAVARCWTAGQRRRAHRALALAMEPGTPGRLAHLLEGGMSEEVAREATRVARVALDEGRLGDARAVLETAILAVDPGEIAELWAEVALTERTTAGLVRLTDVATRSGRDDLAALADAARELAAPAPAVELAFSRVSELQNRTLERWRRALPILRWMRDDPGRAADLLVGLGRWATTQADIAFVEELEGLHSYQRGAYDAAAASHLRASRRNVPLSARIASLTNAASAFLEAHRLDDANEAACAALALAAAVRHPVYELRARMLLRASDYRGERVVAADPAMIEAALGVDAPAYAAMALVTEAALLWRSGKLDEARQIAEAAAAMRGGPLGRMARALAIRCGATPDPRPDVTGLAPGLATQVCWLAGDPRWRSFADELPREHWDRRREVLKVSDLMAQGPGAP